VSIRHGVLLASLLAMAVSGLNVWAQVPAVPAVPAAVPAAPAAPGNIWSKIMMTPDQKAACKKRWCECGLVQFMGAMIKPMTFATGGLIKPCCPGPDDAKPGDLAKPADSADGAAARIKEDEAQAKERRANVRYLGTVDCARYPEAEMALINALRTDRNECVRWEAAIVLGHGCCCTRKTIEALRLTVEASDKDGNPKETSGRVRAAAEGSLYACQSVADLTPEPPEKNPLAPEKKDDGPSEARLPRRIRPVPLATPAAQNPVQPASLQTTRPVTPPVSEVQTRVPTGQRGILDLVRRSMAGAEPPR